MTRKPHSTKRFRGSCPAEHHLLTASDRHAWAIQVTGYALGELVRLTPHIMDDYRDNRPAEFLNLAPPCLVPEHFIPPDMPVDAFVFSRHTKVGPREVDTSHLAVAAIDRVLELRKRQPVVDHDESSLAFHG
jgi:hypothetical protein